MVIIKQAQILTMTGKDYACADLAIEDKKIIEIAECIKATKNDTVIDATGMVLMPGMIDAHTHLGMWEDGMGEEGADGNEDVDPSTPQLRAIDGINPMDRSFEEAREHGITTVASGPGSANVISGQFVALKTKQSYVIEDLVIKEPLALKIAFGENPKRVYKDKGESPVTRMATASMLREKLVEAQQYIKELDEGEQDAEKMPDRDLGKEILAKALKREIFVKAHAHRADDILTAIRIGKEFNLKMSIEHCTEGHLIADVLKKEEVSVVVGPLFGERCKIELKNMTFEAPKFLTEAGVEVAMMSDHPVIPTHYLPVCAGIAVREGLDEYEALKMITINAARALGLEDRMGTLEKGKDADLVLFSGHPFDTRSRVEYVFIDGECVKTPRK